MPKLVRLYIASVAIGFGLSAVFFALLVGPDVAGLRHLILGTEKGWLGGVMLLMFNGIIFAGAQFGIAVMRLAEPGDNEPPSSPYQRISDAGLLAKVPVPAARNLGRAKP